EKKIKEQLRISQKVLDQEKEYRTQISYFERRIFEENSSDHPDSILISTLHGKLISNNETFDKWKKELKSIYPVYHRQNYLNEFASVSDIQKKLNKQSILIEYFLTDSLLYIFGISKDSFLVHQATFDSSSTRSLNYVRNELNNHLASNNSSQKESEIITFGSHSHNLYNRLLEPILSRIKNKSELIILPDGKLNFVPFEILLTDNTKVYNTYRELPFLIKTHNIHYEYSATLLIENQKQKKRGKGYAGFAPEYEGDELFAVRGDDSLMLEQFYPNLTREGLGKLVFNEAEVTEGAGYFKGQSYTGTIASEYEFKRIAENAKILHLAMHALTNDSDPLYSQLIFSEAGDTSEDGRLHAYELQNMDLKADLAVLSACNTGAGKVHRGEGVMSLSRTFKYAGCPNIVMSLWQANDRTTKDIMVSFFKNLKNGDGKADALRQARLEFLESTEEQYTHPYYWATFMLIGDNEPIRMGWEWWWYGLVGLGVATMLAGILFRKVITRYFKI
ncbi:MAG: CHAT domain-containing protein, partial [Bacteroidetes bacterium]|nr:CHAT domain-containing protein [Bacteroidota bacterium]